MIETWHSLELDRGSDCAKDCGLGRQQQESSDFSIHILEFLVKWRTYFPRLVNDSKKIAKKSDSISK